jgi:hypothetical protein
MTVKKCLVYCAVTFILGLLIGVGAMWKLSSRYSLHSGRDGDTAVVYRIDGLTGKTWLYYRIGWLEVGER